MVYPSRNGSSLLNTRKVASLSTPIPRKHTRVTDIAASSSQKKLADIRPNTRSHVAGPSSKPVSYTELSDDDDDSDVEIDEERTLEALKGKGHTKADITNIDTTAHFDESLGDLEGTIKPEDIDDFDLAEQLEEANDPEANEPEVIDLDAPPPSPTKRVTRSSTLSAVDASRKRKRGQVQDNLRDDTVVRITTRRTLAPSAKRMCTLARSVSRYSDSTLPSSDPISESTLASDPPSPTPTQILARRAKRPRPTLGRCSRPETIFAPHIVIVLKALFCTSDGYARPRQVVRLIGEAFAMMREDEVLRERVEAAGITELSSTLIDYLGTYPVRLRTSFKGWAQEATEDKLDLPIMTIPYGQGEESVPDIPATRAFVEKMLADGGWIRDWTNPAYPGPGFSSPAVKQMLGHIYSQSVFSRLPEALRNRMYPVPDLLLALISCSLYFALTEWTTGEWQRSTFRSSVFEAKYQDTLLQIKAVEETDPARYAEMKARANAFVRNVAGFKCKKVAAPAFDGNWL